MRVNNNHESIVLPARDPGMKPMDFYARSSARVVFSTSSSGMTVIVSKGTSRFFYEEWNDSARNEEVFAPRAFKQLILVEKSQELATVVKAASTVMKQEKVQEVQQVAKEVSLEVDVKRNTVLLQPIMSSKSNKDTGHHEGRQRSNPIQKTERTAVAAKSKNPEHRQHSKVESHGQVGQTAYNKKVKEEKRIEAAIARHDRHIAKDEALAERKEQAKV